MFTTRKPLILASRSPRRKRLLHGLGIEFQIAPSGTDESSSGREPPGETARNRARLKSDSVSASFPESWVLGADTIVVLDGRIFGKPEDAPGAERMLGELSGRVHDVITGICLTHAAGNIRRTGSVLTRVRFKHLSEGEIAAYVRTGAPMDKAGAYGIQGRGSFLVRSIEGSYTNVVGLPLCETVEWLLGEGIIEPA